MSQLDVIHSAVRFIDAHLRSPVTVGDIADAVGYSLFHFSRTFNRIVQHTPYDYLMRRRVSESVSDLWDSERLIIDIAYDYQFTNPETFTRAFRRMFGVTPSDARADPRRVRRSPMPALSLAALTHRNDAGAGRPTTIVEPPKELAALQTLVDEHVEGPDELWEMLTTELLRQGLVASRYYALTWAAKSMDVPGRALVSCGAMLEASGEPSQPIAPLLTIRLPERKAVRYPHHGPASAVALATGYLIHTWLPKAKLWAADKLTVLDYGLRPGGGGVPPLAISVGVSAEPLATEARDA